MSVFQHLEVHRQHGHSLIDVTLLVRPLADTTVNVKVTRLIDGEVADKPAADHGVDGNTQSLHFLTQFGLAAFD